MIRDEDRPQLRSTMFLIGAEELGGLVTIEAAMPAIEQAMRDLSQDEYIAPQRWTMALDRTAKMGFMPGALPSVGQFGIKVLSLFDAASRGDLPSHQGVMLLFDMNDGRPLCALDAAALTSLRTAAATAIATRALARPDSETLAIIGCGDLAQPHLAAMKSILPLRRVFIWNRTRERAEWFAEHHGKDMDVILCDTPADTVRDADVVCTLTSARAPILSGEDFRPGQHINLVGSSVAEAREVDGATIARSRYFVDSRSHALSQAGELRDAIERGLLGEDHISGEIGEVLTGRVGGRQNAEETTIYKSLGHVVQDLAVANLAYTAAIGLPAMPPPQTVRQTFPLPRPGPFVAG
ncbi:ornithine cyclodeaminase family protein [Sphingopyxis sp.]|uniref:ornithine cyclodeaminase family protein n=1 Tax=Sphingopyxis sp. TaxID=1908224 RepID=UPI002E37FFF5|nr:ornithine cyclodeaminase family protein [Sphingopyxis sp.]